MANSPYSKLPPQAFWRQGVVQRHENAIHELYTPKFPIRKSDRFVTAGSCFAQHIGRSLKEEGFNVVDEEPFPQRGLKAIPVETRRALGFDLYSARYGNIYTSRQLLQLDKEAHGDLELTDPIWEKDATYFDSQRPNIDIAGFELAETVRENRKHHLDCVRQAFSKADIFVFTFGLTETWAHRASGEVYPVAPGVIAGTHDDETYTFKNLGYSDVLSDFLEFRERMMSRNPEVRFLVTVSPVPLTATMSGQHVEIATVRSKSILRAVCAELYDSFENVDYFPSYEMTTSQKNQGGAFASNLRTVKPSAVELVMNSFLKAHGYNSELTIEGGVSSPGLAEDHDMDSEDDLVCEEMLLDGFGSQ
ncbi:GSCFA domain-containing protein [Roseovarius confluentis]|uniref:GSCFA domain-containing protein n=1 Tax=Roseovarius confluentis TaxID=1852027 RepID=UPI000CDD264A|nr:GSCFA domain-containing protein [Roseovarius confluentis]